MANRKKSTFERLTNGQLNRKQRREWMRKLSAEDAGLEIVNRNVAGIDVGNESHFVAVPVGRDAQPVQEFGSWTADLERMAEGLRYRDGRDAVHWRVLDRAVRCARSTGL